MSFFAVVPLCYLRIIELRLHRVGLNLTASTAMERMQRLHSCLWWSAGKRKPLRLLEESTAEQAFILNAFGYEVAGGVLQKISR